MVCLLQKPKWTKTGKMKLSEHIIIKFKKYLFKKKEDRPVKNKSILHLDKNLKT